MADKKPRALIVGGSVGGLFTALMLRRIGWDAEVFERASGDLASRGAAIGVTAELFETMRRLDLPPEDASTSKVQSFVALDRSGSIAHREARQMLTTHWSNVYRPLRSALPDSCYRAGVAFDRMIETPAGVTAIFSDGSRAEGDLLIGADGINSAVRARLMPSVQPHYAGYVAWRAVVEETAVAEPYRELVFNHLIFAITETDLLLCIPLPAHDDAANGRARRAVYLWYRPADFETTLPKLFTDATGKQHGLAIPPPLIRPELIEELKAVAAERFAPMIAEIVARAERPLLHAIFDLQTPQMVFGRVALLGDSAFVARPHAVAGVTKAALDAQFLTEAIKGGDLAGGLARYEAQRLAFGQKIVAHAQRLGAHIAASNMRERRASPDPAVMLRDYGAPHLLADR